MQHRNAEARTTLTEGPVTVFVTPAGAGQAYVAAGVSGVDTPPAATARKAYELIASVLASEGMHVVHERLFGSISARQDVMHARREVLDAGGLDHVGPPTYIQGGPCGGEGLAGVLIQAVRPSRDADVREVLDAEGNHAGYRWTRNGARFIVLQNVHGAEAGNGEGWRRRHAASMFEKASAILQANGSSYRGVLRTWIYLSGLLDWYGEFNAVRNDLYGRLGLMPKLDARDARDRILLPASTGIEGHNPANASCAMDVLALADPACEYPQVEQLTNSRQEDAFRYGSAFSRAAFVGETDLKSVSISGTAAIDERGRSCHRGDLPAQINLTLDSIQELIGQKGLSLGDICEACVFFKNGDEQAVAEFRRIAARRGLADIPAIHIHADVCRDDLLFEIDGTAVAPASC
jgi:enamine deaminase RidA (YjgF/YER057c/UK114 family)